MNANITKTTTTTAGSGTVTISVPSSVPYGPVDYYLYSSSNWERGYGIYHDSKLYRSQVFSSSNGNDKISLVNTSDVLFYPSNRNLVYVSGNNFSSGDSLFYNGIYWDSRSISSGDVISALGYIPGSGGENQNYLTSPISINDVTDLQSSLDGKASVGHTHTMSDITDLSLSGVSSSNVVNVLSFGVSTTGNPVQNSLNLSEAIDAAIYINRKTSTINGSKVYFPGTSSGVIELTWPVFTNGNNITIEGEGKNATTINSHGPAFVVGKHPKYWSVLYPVFDDKFAVTGNLTNGNTNVSNIGYTPRMRIGSAVSGVGIQADTIVTGINVSAGSISLSKPATTTSASSLYFSSDRTIVSGVITSNSPIVSGITPQHLDRISVGASITGVNIPSNAYVLYKVPESGMVVMNKTSTSNGQIDIGVDNYINNSIITISGVATAGSNIITGISNKDILRVFPNVKIHSLAINGSLNNIYSSAVGGAYTDVLKVDKENNTLEISTNSLDDYNGLFTITNGWFDANLHFEDVNDFYTGNLFPANGDVSFTYAQVPGTYKAVRTRGNIGQFRVPFTTMNTGDPRSSSSVTPWVLHKKVLWEFLIYHHDAELKGGIIGSGGVGAPDPWFLSGGDNSGNSGTPTYFFDLAVTDSDMINISVLRTFFAQNPSVGLHRISIQYDRDNASIIAWVDGVQVASTTYDLSPFVGGFYPMEGGVFEKFDRIARWKYSELVVGGSYSNLGKGNSVLGSERETDFSVLSAACYKNHKYLVSTVGSLQEKISGGYADNSYVFFRPGYNSNDPDVIGWMTCGTEYADPQNSEINIYARNYTREGVFCVGFLCPRGIGSHGTGGAVVNTKISGFNLVKNQGSPLSCGIYLTPFLYLNIADIKSLGYMATIGSCETVSSYDAYYSDLDLGSMIHIVHQIAYINRIKFPYPKYSAIRTVGSQVHLKNFICPSPEMHTEGFWTDFAGGSIGAGIKVEDGIINWEDFHIYPALYQFYIQKRGDHGGNYFILKNVVFGTFAVPGIILDDIIPNSRVDSYVSIENSPFAGVSPAIHVRGPDWHGRVKINNVAYFNDTIKYLPSINSLYQPDNPRLIGVNDEYYGPPVGGGGFVNDCHEIVVNKPAIGGVSKWICKTDSVTGIRYEGTSNPPKWVPLEFCKGSGMNDVSINSFNTIYAEADLPWKVGNVTTLKNSCFQFDFSDSVLSHILTGKNPTNRSKAYITWGYGLQNPMRSLNAFAGGTFFSSNFIDVKDYFSSASGGYRENNTGIYLNGSAVPGWPVSLNSECLFGIHVGTNINNNSGVIMGKTIPVDSGFWKINESDSFTLPSGAIRIKYVERDGGWTKFAADKIMNYILDGSANAASSPSDANFPSTLYLGLSKTYVSSSGTNITEVSGNSYSRVPIPMNSGVWARINDRKEFWGNISGISFPVPNEDWGLIRSTFLSDESSGGNIYHFAKLNSPIRVYKDDDPVTFNKYAIQLQL